jgi:hypothetical protein
MLVEDEDQHGLDEAMRLEAVACAKINDGVHQLLHAIRTVVAPVVTLERNTVPLDALSTTLDVQGKEPGLRRLCDDLSPHIAVGMDGDGLLCE